jgi:hypothetical protein
MTIVSPFCIVINKFVTSVLPLDITLRLKLVTLSIFVLSVE